DGTETRYIYFDNAASTPTLKPVLDSLNEFMEWYSNIHRGTGFKSLISTYFFEQAREIVADFFNISLDDHLVIFGKNGTEAINKLAHRVPLPEDCIILVTQMEHHSNDLPWRIRGQVVHVNVDRQGRLDWQDFEKKLDQYKGRVGLVAVTGASNVTGYINDIHRVAELAHKNNAKIMVDAAQLAPHRRIDIKSPDDPQHLDFLAFSAHKIYAPFGLGVLIADKETFVDGDPDIVGGGTVSLVSEDYAYWTDAPEKEEAGTPNVAGAIALAKALKLIMQIGMDKIAEHEAELTRYALKELKKIPGLIFYGSVDEKDVHNRLGVISFNIKDMPHALVGAILNYEGGVGVRNGCFCAHPYVKCLLGVSIEETKILEEKILSHDRSSVPGAVRVSFGMYNTHEEVDLMIHALKNIVEGRYSGDYVMFAETGEYHPRNFKINFEDYFRL
ncbi:MAG: aminotransferase class V-fold PLP-dependent enzyme, partial [Calditrichales bacterium]